jgi:hypothetical protein
MASQTKPREACKPKERPALEKGKAAEAPVMTIEKHEKPGNLKLVTGCHDDKLSMVLFNQLFHSLQLFPNSAGIEDSYREDLKKSAALALEGIGPKTEAEGLLAVQMVACHSAAMECYRRAMLSGQTVEGRDMELKFANKLSRTYATLLETLMDSRRGKGRQKVTVKHVHVHPGGQAIVGHVQTGGSKSKSEVQPHANTLTNSPEPPMRGPLEANGQALPGACNAERPLSDARREVGSD